MLDYIKNYLRPLRISYGITVCNEAMELDRLLHILTSLIDNEDEIIVLQDITNRSVEVDIVIQKYNEKIERIEAELNNDFATFKNRLISKAQKDYLFQIDADEIPSEFLIKNIRKILTKNYKKDCFLVPRINTVEGITESYIQQWKWRMDSRGYINFPDYQSRIFRLHRNICWKNNVHEVLCGYNRLFTLPAEEKYCLSHPKTLDIQIIQNKLYDKIEG